MRRITVKAGDRKVMDREKRRELRSSGGTWWMVAYVTKFWGPLVSSTPSNQLTQK